MKRREFLTLLGKTATAWPLAARAQQVGKVHRIGFLGSATAAGSAEEAKSLRTGLRDAFLKELNRLTSRSSSRPDSSLPNLTTAKGLSLTSGVIPVAAAIS